MGGPARARRLLRRGGMPTVGSHTVAGSEPPRMRHIRVDAQWLELIGGLLATPLMAMPAGGIALQRTDSFVLVGASYERRAPGRAPQRQLWPLDERFGGHRAEIEQWRP